MPVSWATLSSLARPHSFKYQLVSISLIRNAFVARNSAPCRCWAWLSRVLSWELRWPRCPAREAADCLRCLEGSSGPPRPTELLRAAIMAGRAPSSLWSPGESGCNHRILRPFNQRMSSFLTATHSPSAIQLSMHFSLFVSFSFYVRVIFFSSLSYNLPACWGWNQIWLSSWVRL